jgi:hypothetical protein
MIRASDHAFVEPRTDYDEIELLADLIRATPIEFGRLTSSAWPNLPEARDE